MIAKHTPGPWRWEFNSQHKNMHLVGGVPTYDLTVMDFARWGMDGACVRLREDVDGMNIMHRLADRPEWVAPLPGREHHAKWCADVVHPDMRLIAAAPDLLEVAREALAVIRVIKPPENGNGTIVRLEDAISKATGEKA